MFTTLTPHLSVHHGAVNIGVVRDGDRALLINAGDGAAISALAAEGVRVAGICFTHHHRAMAWGAHDAIAAGAVSYVPAAERGWFENPQAFWDNPKYHYGLDNLRPHHHMLAEGFRVDHVLADGDTVAWGPATVTALATPGHTDGALSYLVEVDGRTVAFTGDLIYAPGQVFELSSMQKGNDIVGDYHGYMGTRDQVIASLRRVQDAGAEVLVPAHGVIMGDPRAAIDALQAQLQVCYDDFAAISALRWYFPRMVPTYLDGPNVMPIRKGQPAPDFLRNYLTTWAIVSESGAAFIIDCVNDDVVAEIQRWQDAGEITSVEGLWITHYHYDHIDGIAAFTARFGGPVIADPAVAQIVTNPSAWRLTCVSPIAVAVDHWTAHGERWQWHEFTLTAFNFPGQTLYHDALLVEGRGQRLLFVGDSFTPAGIDDYCAHNRNFLGAGVGYNRCLDIIEALQPVLLFNQHVEVAFDFTAEEIAYMRANLARREKTFGNLFPWDHPNYGTDDYWVYAAPYAQFRAPGATAHLDIIVTNHSAVPHTAAVRAALPRAWGGGHTPETTTTIPAKTVGRLPLRITIPADAKPGRYAIPIDIQYDELALPQINEAVIEVKETV